MDILHLVGAEIIRRKTQLLSWEGFTSSRIQRSKRYAERQNHFHLHPRP